MILPYPVLLLPSPASPVRFDVMFTNHEGSQFTPHYPAITMRNCLEARPWLKEQLYHIRGSTMYFILLALDCVTDAPLNTPKVQDEICRYPHLHILPSYVVLSTKSALFSRRSAANSPVVDIPSIKA